MAATLALRSVRRRLPLIEASHPNDLKREPLKFAALINALSGGVETSAAFEARLRSSFAAGGLSADVEIVDGDRLRKAGERALARAKAGEIAGVLVGGGDGSVRTLAGILAGTGIPLGVLPLGTLNHFARDLGIAPSLEAAIAVIAAGDVRSVDVAEVNGEIFINNSSIGLYPYMVLDRERRRHLHGSAKWPAMALAAWRTLRHLPVRRLKICAEGWTEPCRTPCAFIGNNEYSLAVPSLGRRARLDAGTLCFYVARSQGRGPLVRLALRSMLGLARSAELRTFSASTAEIISRTSRLPVALDGEVKMLRPPLHYRTRPGALRVFAPASAAIRSAQQNPVQCETSA